MYTVRVFVCFNHIKDLNVITRFSFSFSSASTLQAFNSLFVCRRDKNKKTLDFLWFDDSRSLFFVFLFWGFYTLHVCF